MVEQRADRVPARGRRRSSGRRRSRAALPSGQAGADADVVAGAKAAVAARLQHPHRCGPRPSRGAATSAAIVSNEPSPESLSTMVIAPAIPSIARSAASAARSVIAGVRQFRMTVSTVGRPSGYSAALWQRPASARVRRRPRPRDHRAHPRGQHAHIRLQHHGVVVARHLDHLQRRGEAGPGRCRRRHIPAPR